MGWQDDVLKAMEANESNSFDIQADALETGNMLLTDIGISRYTEGNYQECGNDKPDYKITFERHTDSNKFTIIIHDATENEKNVYTADRDEVFAFLKDNQTKIEELTNSAVYHKDMGFGETEDYSDGPNVRSVFNMVAQERANSMLVSNTIENNAVPVATHPAQQPMKPGV